MRKLAAILAIIVVVTVVGFYVFKALTTESLTFVSDTEKVLPIERSFNVHRLYSSDIDSEGLKKYLDEVLTSTEFTDEEINEAALAAGNPEFYPAFYFNFTRENKDSIMLSGIIEQEIMNGQRFADYAFSNLRVEATTGDGMVIKDASSSKEKLGDNTTVPVISASGSDMTMAFGNDCDYSILFDNKSGSVRLFFAYDVVVNDLFKKVVLSDQVMIVDISVETGDNSLDVTYTLSEQNELEPKN